MQLVHTNLKVKIKLNKPLLLTGSKPRDHQFEAYNEDDLMIMAWLWNLITP